MKNRLDEFIVDHSGARKRAYKRKDAKSVEQAIRRMPDFDASVEVTCLFESKATNKLMKSDVRPSFVWFCLMVKEAQRK